jgi:hypothetical protein
MPEVTLGGRNNLIEERNELEGSNSVVGGSDNVIIQELRWVLCCAPTNHDGIFCTICVT